MYVNVKTKLKPNFMMKVNIFPFCRLKERQFCRCLHQKSSKF